MHPQDFGEFFENPFVGPGEEQNNREQLSYMLSKRSHRKNRSEVRTARVVVLILLSVVALSIAAIFVRRLYLSKFVDSEDKQLVDPGEPRTTKTLPKKQPTAPKDESHEELVRPAKVEPEDVRFLSTSDQEEKKTPTEQPSEQEPKEVKVEFPEPEKPAVEALPDLKLDDETQQEPVALPATRPIDLDLGEVVATPWKDISKADNKNQWDVDVNRAKEICALDGEDAIKPLSDLGLNVADQLAQMTLARILEEPMKGKQTFTEREQVQVEEAINILKRRHRGADDRTFSLSNFSLCSDEEGKGDSVQFVWKGILGVGATSVVFEVEPKDKELKDKLGGQPLAMKVFVQIKPDDATQQDVQDASEFVHECVTREHGVLRAVQQPNEPWEKTLERSGLACQMYSAHLGGDGMLGETVKAIFHKQVLFSPVMATDVYRLLKERKGKDALPLDVKLNVVKQILMELGHLHAAGQLNNDVKIDNVLIDKDGKVYVTDFGASTSVNEERPLWSPVNFAPEQLRELEETSTVTATETAEAWGAGMAAYLTLTDKVPFEWNQSKSYAQMLFDESTVVLAEDFDVTKFPSPAFGLRLAGVPEEWVCIVTSLLQPDPDHRPTVRQILKAFPDIFQ